MNDWWRAITTKTQVTLTLLSQSIQTGNPNPSKLRQKQTTPSLFTRMFEKIKQKHTLRTSQLKSALSGLQQDQQYGEFSQQDLSPVIISRNRQQSQMSDLQLTSAEGIIKSSQPSFSKQVSQKVAPEVGEAPNPQTPQTQKMLPEKRMKLARFFEESLIIVRRRVENVGRAVGRVFEKESIITESEPVTETESENQVSSRFTEHQSEENPMSKRKPSQRALDQLKKAIKEYQKQGYAELALNKKTNIGNISGKINLTSSLQPPKSTISSQIGSKSFRISRTNQHQLPKLQSRTTSLQKNHSQYRRPLPYPTLQSRTHSQTKRIQRIDSEPKVQDSFDERLKKLKKQQMPKLDIQKLEYRHQRKQLDSINMDMLLSLRKEGAKEKQTRKEMLNDLKMTNIMKNMVNTESYSKTVDKETRSFLEEIKMPMIKKEHKSPQKITINKEKLSSIYQAVQRSGTVTSKMG